MNHGMERRFLSRAVPGGQGLRESVGKNIGVIGAEKTRVHASCMKVV